MEKIIYAIVYASFDARYDYHYVDTFLCDNEEKALNRFNIDKTNAYEDCKESGGGEDPHEEMWESGGIVREYQCNGGGLYHCIKLTVKAF